MKRKTIYDAMKSYVESTLSDIPNDLINIGADTVTDKDTGEISSFIRVEAEVPRGFDALSRCRFTVKIPSVPLKITEEQAENEEYSVSFKGLIISYSDSKGTVYFKADDYSVKPVNWFFICGLIKKFHISKALCQGRSKERGV